MSTDFQAFKQLDRLAEGSGKHLFSFSPNDALVQISLPLVLILAIAARLMILSQNVAMREDRDPAVIDLWKQQLILRIDKVLENWEKTSEYLSFPEPSRILWENDWPADERFQRLCRDGAALDEIDQLALDLYHAALSYRPPESEVAEQSSFAYFFEIYDPQAPNRPPNADSIPPEFTITPERREFALDYVAKRCLGWKRGISDLQWALVAACAARQPVTEDWSDRQLAAQMRKLADALRERGYPLLRDVTREYQKEMDETP